MLRSIITAVLPLLAATQSCGPSPSGSIKPAVASGYRYQVVASGLSTPRGLAFDSENNLLVVETGEGIVSAHSLATDGSGCVSVTESRAVTENATLNHGIAVSEDSYTLYASNSDQAYAWDYNSTTRDVSNRRTLVVNMTGTDHSTRTLLLPKSAPGMLVVSFGSLSNLDFQASNLNSGPATVKAFNLNNRTNTAYNYQNDGLLLGWGLRNEVGLGEHPTTGGIWGVENSADEMFRYGVDIHASNPGEELNFLGYLNGTASTNQGSNFGYPWCFSAWNTTILPQNANISTGTQFAIDASPDLENRNQTDAYCANQTQASLVFQSHMAPLDIKFNDTGRQAWISFHGSWDSPNPVGYKVSTVAFTDAGEPVDKVTSMTAATDILYNEDNSVCPSDCFRPAGIAIDVSGRIFVSSDASGEIYMVVKDASATTGSTASGTSAVASSTRTASFGARKGPATGTAGLACLIGLLAVML